MPLDVEQFIDASIDAAREQAAAHAAVWNHGKEERWDADQETGEIVFTFADGTIAKSHFQIVGAYNTLDLTWLWAWGSTYVDEALKEHAKLAKAWGEANEVVDFIDRKFMCMEVDAWAFTAVTVRLAKANGCFRGMDGDICVFMTFGEIRLEKPAP